MPDKILIVDDDKEFREELGQCLNDYEVIQAASGDEAMGIIKKPNEISLIIMDVKMPGMSGNDALARIKEMSSNIKVVIMTGYGSKDVVVEALRGHADEYIEKPFASRDIREIVDRFLTGKRPGQNGFEDADNKINRVKNFIKRNCCNKICLDDAARLISFCPKYLSRVFKEKTGMGFGEFRIKVQMEKAKEFLVEGEHNVNQISDKMGYQNTESFIRQFKKTVGCTPTEYKLKHGGPKKAGR